VTGSLLATSSETVKVAPVQPVSPSVEMTSSTESAGSGSSGLMPALAPSATVVATSSRLPTPSGSEAEASGAAIPMAVQMSARTGFTGLHHQEQEEAHGGGDQNAYARKRKFVLPLVEKASQLRRRNSTRLHEHGADEQ
jgi:hypothetical protein